MSSIEFRLRRPNLDTPWGFRLQGGQDVNQPLTIQRVFNGSPADGNLQRGDVLLSINDHNVSGGYLKSAEELVRGSNNNLTVVVRRTGQIVNSSQPIEDLSPQQPRHRTLDSSAGSPSRYSQQSVTSSHQSQPQQQQQQRGGNVWRPSQQQQQPTVDVYSNHSGDYPQSLTSPVGSAVSPADAGTSVYLPTKTKWSVDSRPQQQQQQQQQRPAGFGQQWSSGQHDHDQQALPPFSHQQQSVQQAGHAQNFTAKPTSSPLSSSTTPQSSHQGQGQGQGPRFQPQPADADDDYEAKSVRDIKKMFNQLAKPLAFGPKQSASKPGPWQDSQHQLPKNDDVSNSRSSWHDSEPSKAGSSSLLPKRQPQNSTFSQSSRTSFSPPSSAAAAPSKSNSSALYDYPPPRQELTAVGQLNRSTMSKPVAAQTKPGAGYSYQGIVTVTPAKTVHGKNSSSGQSGQPANKKKEFDPSQSLVYQMLQEENERKKRGEVDAAEEEEAGPPRQQQQQQRPQQTGRGGRGGGGGAGSGHGPQYEQPQQRSSRLQELLERDQAQSQQLEDQSGGSVYGQQQPMSAKSRREMSPSYPGHHPSHDPRPAHQSPSRQRQQQPQHHQQQQHHHQQSGAGAANHQHHYQVQQHEQQYHYQQPTANQQMYTSASSSGGYDGYGTYDGGYQNTAASAYDGGYSGGIPISDF